MSGRFIQGWDVAWASASAAWEYMKTVLVLPLLVFFRTFGIFFFQGLDAEFRLIPTAAADVPAPAFPIQ